MIKNFREKFQIILLQKKNNKLGDFILNLSKTFVFDDDNIK